MEAWALQIALGRRVRLRAGCQRHPPGPPTVLATAARTPVPQVLSPLRPPAGPATASAKSVCMQVLWHFLVETKRGNVLLGLIALVVAKYLLDLVARIAHWVLVGNRAAQRAMRSDRRVGLTINTVLISLARYLVYFVMVGWILITLGVHLSQYLASVSFVAIAIGFGTQGLVQDVVTGFFLIFERQMDVGDMVILNGQTGIVKDFGLRLTEVRLYDGGRALIPNRSIGQVINYRSGALVATVDVVLTAATGRREMVADALRRTTTEIVNEFSGVVRGAPTHVPWTDADGDGGFTRARLPIWPGQTWLVDGHWVPRLKARLAAAGLEEAQYQVAVHYYAEGPLADPAQGPHWPHLTLPRRGQRGAPPTPPVKQ